MTKQAERILEGRFSYENGELSFSMTTRNVSFGEVEAALIKLRDEADRQIKGKAACPHNPEYKSGIVCMDCGEDVTDCYCYRTDDINGPINENFK